MMPVITSDDGHQDDARCCLPAACRKSPSGNAAMNNPIHPTIYGTAH
jgi:hypothetical protein